MIERFCNSRLLVHDELLITVTVLVIESAWHLCIRTMIYCTKTSLINVTHCQQHGRREPCLIPQQLDRPSSSFCCLASRCCRIRIHSASRFSRCTVIPVDLGGKKRSAWQWNIPGRIMDLMPVLTRHDFEAADGPCRFCWLHPEEASNTHGP